MIAISLVMSDHRSKCGVDLIRISLDDTPTVGDFS